MPNAKLESILLQMLKSQILEIRDLSAGEKPFIYTSHNFGPGYVSIKDLVGNKQLIKLLCKKLTKKILLQATEPEFIAGNVTRGVIPAWLISEYLEKSLNKQMPFVYIRKNTKDYQKYTLITGLKNNSQIRIGANCLIVEELVNFGHTICTSAELLRNTGYKVTNAACILFYNNPESTKALKNAQIQITYLFTLPELLQTAAKYKIYPENLISDYKQFLKNPATWQKKHWQSQNQ